MTPRISLLPYPYATILGKEHRLSKTLQIVNRFSESKSAIEAFVSDWNVTQSPKGQILTILKEPSLAEEEYRITFGPKIEIKASTRTGVAWALQTLGQLLGQPSNIDSIHDEPDVRFHSISTLKTMARWCQLGKVRFMQLHLTDDQNWMLPSESIPGVDKRNQHHRPAYTKAELKELQAFASARGVTIVPEIDIPGHSSLLVASSPDIFQIQNSESRGCVNFGSHTVRTKLKELIQEIAKLFFDSPYVHIGGDEAWYPNAEKDPQMQTSLKNLSGNPSQVFVDFVGEMADEVLRLNKRPIVWEGFSASAFAKRRIPKKTIVVAWEGTYYPAKQLIPDGFQVVNGGWDPNYVVNHFPYDSYTVVPLERLYMSDFHQFAVVSGAMSPFRFPNSNLLKGSMLCWWEGHEWNTQCILPSRIVAFGSQVWNKSGEKDFGDFTARSSEAFVTTMRQAFPFQYEVEGALRSDESLFAGDQMTIRFFKPEPGDKIGWRIDGQVPTIADVTPGLEIVIKHDTVVTIQKFIHDRPAGETLFLPIHKVSLVKNLAYHCSVTTSCAEDPQFAAKLVTDGVGDLLSSFWLAYPNPQTLTIDLGSIKTVGRLEVVAFWATGALTRYRLALSLDGKNFATVVDASKQTKLATKAGYIHQISPTRARYIRMETLGSDLFPPTMTRINEIRAFEN